jgi:hypothetical protein
MIVQEVSGKSLGDTDLSTALIAVPGTLIGLGIVYAVGIRSEERLD